MRNDSHTVPYRGRGRKNAWSVLVSLLFAVALAIPALASPPAERSASAAQPATQSPAEAQQAAAEPAVLVFRGPVSRQEDPVEKATQTIRELGDQHGFTVEESVNPEIFASGTVERFRAVVFLSNEGSELNDAQAAGLQEYVEGGGGFLGVHDAARALPDSDWYTDLIGTRMAGSPFAVQDAVVDVIDRQHPATKDLPLKWEHSDRWSNWTENPSGDVHTVAQVGESTYDPGENGHGAFHPISWCHDVDSGRSFYTGMGATDASYDDDAFRTHLLGAVQWTSGTVRADCQATIASNYTTERITAPNQEGELDQIGESHGVTVASDGTVFYVGKGACPSGPVVEWDNPDVGLGCGTIHQWDPDTEEVTLLTTLDVMGNRGSGDELVKNEEGLLGIVPDPNFEENNWIYVYWMPHESIDREKRTGQRTISRFTYDPEGPSIDQASRVDLLEWTAQIHSCCHAGGGMAFDDDGNLYVGSGDNNSSQGSDGYSGNNWTEEYAGLSFQDARRTSGNTNDLNGKIIRIHPEDDGTYTIPAGNLFTGDEEGGGKTRPEIYVMGVRNISRLQIDADTDWLTAAWVGPDAAESSPTWGPAKYETASIITSAGNQGWPFCMGNNQPYRDRSNEDATQPADWYDCDNLQNTSPRNTGLVDIPNSRPNNIWYSPLGGGPTFPTRDDSDVPTYNDDEATYTIPYLTGGGQAVMSGPTYRQSQVDSGSDVAWPSYWEGKWFIGDQSNDQNRVAVTMDPATVNDFGQPAFGEDLRNIITAGNGDTDLTSWMDAKFGPDGALYLLDYGEGFFSLDENQKLLRVTYDGGPPTPAPASADAPTVSAASSEQGTPTKMNFDGGSVGGVSWEWDFGDGNTSTLMNPTHTYTEGGTYAVTLDVTYADGETATVEQEVEVACPAPDARDTVRFLDRDTGVANEDVRGGCTINDIVDDEAEWGSHAQFVSYIEGLTERMDADGSINPNQQWALDRAAQASEVGQVNSYEPIFDGSQSSLAGWEQAGDGAFNLEDDGSITSEGGLGMLWYADQDYGDFSVRLQFRDVSPEEGTRANTGVFTRFPDVRTPVEERPDGCGTTGSAVDSPAWVAIFCGQEIQIYDGDSGESQKTGSVYNFDPVDLEDAGATDKEVWNDYEIRVEGQQYTIIRNGERINTFSNEPGQESSREGDPPTDLRQFTRGYIGLQNHSDDEVVQFRNIRVRPL